MLVILKKDVSKLGHAGDIVRVAPGYGRNYLIPRGLALPASEGNVVELEHQKRVADSIRRAQLADATALADKLANTAVTIKREAGEDDKLFGSVTNRDIAESLAAEGIEIDRRTIVLDEPIRAIGLYTVNVKLHRDVAGQVKVFVIRA